MTGPTRIAVSDPSPTFRQGVLTTLAGAGFEAADPTELLRWIAEDRPPVVVLTVQTPEDWSVLAELRRSHPDAAVIALLTDTGTATYLRAVRAGAAAVPRDAPTALLRLTCCRSIW